jgi:uncharacterized protein YndB with AHSA1/START domain
VATVSFSTVIERPAEEIFDLLADIRRNPEWCPGFGSAEKLSPDPIGPGSLFVTSMPGMGELQIQITRYEHPRRIWFTASAAAAQLVHNFELTEVQHGTNVVQQISVRPRGVLKLLAPIMAVMLKRGIQRNTAALKQYLERGAAQSAVTSACCLGLGPGCEHPGWIRRALDIVSRRYVAVETARDDIGEDSLARLEHDWIADPVVRVQLVSIFRHHVAHELRASRGGVVRCVFGPPQAYVGREHAPKVEREHPGYDR